MLKQRTAVFWECAKCRGQHRFDAVLSEYEPAVYYCDHCGYENWLELPDLVDAQGKRWLTGRRLAWEPE